MSKGPGKRIGYVRVSTTDQNTERQLDGIELDKTFEDKCSGSTTNRPALKAMLDYVRDGDTLYVHSLDRLGRNLHDLLLMVARLTDDGVTVIFVKQNLTFSGEPNPMNDLMLGLLGAVAQFERAMIRERQAEGIAIAKRKGVYKGRKPTLDDATVQELRLRAADPAISKAALAREYGISRMTMYRYLDGHA
jgi:DNA invertase Pin-like site-specific DNA recombinase